MRRAAIRKKVTQQLHREPFIWAALILFLVSVITSSILAESETSTSIDNGISGTLSNDPLCSETSSSTPTSTCNVNLSDNSKLSIDRAPNCIPNPAAIYCKEMGYEYKIVTTEKGEQGICILPNGQEVDEWDFYEGKVGQDFSYCASKGWPIAAQAKGDNFSSACTTCVMPDGTQKTVSDLLEIGKKQCGQPYEDVEMIAAGNVDKEQSMTILMPWFDWRDAGGGNWMTPVKNQGICGSCWAFSVVGVVEALYNIQSGNPDLDINLSEQYLVSDCLPFNSCCGGSRDKALSYMRDSGITDEACFPYKDGDIFGCSCENSTCDSNCKYSGTGVCSDCKCSDRCADWNNRLYTIGNWGGLPPNIDAMRHQLVERGPLSISLNWCGGFDEDDIYRCDGCSADERHAVVLVGYDDAGGYWIAKNSYGSTWGPDDNGYFKIGYDECSIGYIRYATLDRIIYVNDSASGSKDGTSWANAYTNLQDALDDASYGADIWVASGTYMPTVEVGGEGDKYRTFQMENGVAIYGGFPSTGNPTWVDRDWEENTTTLSGDIGVKGSNSDNCYHVFYHPEDSGLNGTAILDGFTITGGYADGSYTHNDGGGMYNVSSSPAVTNCTFSGNLANSYGGGMYNHYYSSYYSSPAVSNCTFYGNSSNYNGGGIYNDNSSPEVTNCILWGDTAPLGDEISIESGTPVFTYCDIEGGYPGAGNINSDPLWVNPGSGDFHLQDTSPCINAGINSAPNLPDTDFEGDNRIIDSVVDMGVDEFNDGAPWSCLDYDANSDGKIEYVEMVDALMDYLTSGISYSQMIDVLMCYLIS